MPRHAYAVVELERTNPHARRVVVNPARSWTGLTLLVDPAESEEATEPFLSRARTATSRTVTDEAPHVRWPIPSSLLATR